MQTGSLLGRALLRRSPSSQQHWRTGLWCLQPLFPVTQIQVIQAELSWDEWPMSLQHMLCMPVTGQLRNLAWHAAF